MREAELLGRIVKGRNGRILATLYRAAGDEKHPVVLLCHGFPGYDQFTDLAYELQENGYDVMTFHYSGSWGSDGDYSLENGLSDTDTMVDVLLETQDAAQDLSKLYIIGHSLGGFFAANTFARRKEIAAAVLISPADMYRMYEETAVSGEAKAAFAAELAGDCLPLRGVDGTKLTEEIGRLGSRYAFTNLAPKFGDRPVLLVGGTKDTTTPMPLCVEPLREAAEQIPGSRLETEVFDAAHSYLNVRAKLRREVLRFLGSLQQEEGQRK